jgi:DNA invertase Pin-like site-specific DNA recombinase
MAEGKFVSYLRVSTTRQGRSGLGLEAQRKAVEDYLNGGNWQLVKEFVEVESGKKADRPQLEKAFQLCRLLGAKLVIAKLDRLSRDVHFLSGLQKAGIEFICADMPHATPLTIHILSAVAQHEREMISQRTKAALAAAKRRGKQLGGYRAGSGFDAPAVAKRAWKASAHARQEIAQQRAADIAPIVKELQAAGAVTLLAIAAELNDRGIPTARGGQWSATQVMRLLEDIDGPFVAAAA